MSVTRRHQVVKVLLAIALAVALIATGAAGGSAQPAGKAAQPADDLTAQRDMLLVGNNWDGTIDVIDPRTLERVGRFEAAPDFEQVVAGMGPDQQTARQLNNEFAA